MLSTSFLIAEDYCPDYFIFEEFYDYVGIADFYNIFLCELVFEFIIDFYPII